MYKLISLEKLKNFNKLNCAVRLLADPNQCIYNNEFAHGLLVQIVDEMKTLYGDHMMIFNVHNLTHLSSDVISMGGPLDSFSAFEFENYLQIMKKMIRKGAMPLPQVLNRMAERVQNLSFHERRQRREFILSKPYVNAELPDGFRNAHSMIEFKNFTVTNKSPNNCCYVRNGAILLIKCFAYLNNEAFVIGHKFLNHEMIDHYPCDSRLTGIIKTKQSSDLCTAPVSGTLKKGLHIHFSNYSSVLPIIHSDRSGQH